MNIDKVYCGIDVSKNYLDTFINGKYVRFENNLKGVSKMKKSALGAHFIFESTAGYERIAAWSLMKDKQSVSIVNPGRVRDFARSQGYLAKTDKIDAIVITEFAQTKKSLKSVLPSKEQQKLTALVLRRSQLIDIKTAESNRLDTLLDEDVKSEVKDHLDYLKLKIKSIEASIKSLIDTTPLLKEKANKLQSMRGLGPVATMALLAYMPELGSLTRGQAAALLGVAPYNKDSGSKRGKRQISGGRKELRCILYMGALAAIRGKGYLHDYYNRLVEENGRPKKVALVAVMRKMIIAANSMLKNDDFKACA